MVRDSNSKKLITFLVDSGCSDHMVSANYFLHNITNNKKHIMLADGKSIESYGVGEIECRQSDEYPILLHTRVMSVPKLEESLLLI
jgi:hypothetical protein